MPRTISGQTILLPQFSGAQGRCLYELNETAAYLWHEMAEEFTEEGLLEKLTREFEIEPALAARDLRALLATLRDLGAIA